MKNKYKYPKKFILVCLIVLIAGFLYYLIVDNFGVSIPCPIFLWTGFKCPGCGITTMFIEILHGNFYEAFLANPLTFCLLPFWLLLIIYLSYKYIKYGHLNLPKWLNMVIIILVCLYLMFGLVRNLPVWPY